MAEAEDHRPAPGGPGSLGEDEVLGYLLEHPDFLVAHPEVLMTSTPPARFGGGNDTVVDMQQVMLKRLQSEMAELQDCAEQLILTTRSNMATQKGTLQATLAILDSEGLGPLVRTVNEDLPMLLDVDVCTLRFEQPAARKAQGVRPLPEDDGLDLATLPTGFVDDMFGPDAQAVLRPSVDAEAPVYGDLAGQVASDALVRLDPGRGIPPGLLALASRVEGTFEPDMAMDLLVFLAKVLESCVRRWTPETTT